MAELNLSPPEVALGIGLYKPTILPGLQRRFPQRLFRHVFARQDQSATHGPLGKVKTF
jgi:hypothetical protein